MKNISIIIPTYNEEKAVGETLTFFKSLLDNYPQTEVIFVDDGSTDKTPQKLQSVKHDQIKVITSSTNEGYGAAIKKGVKESSYQYIAITDADGSYPNEKLPFLFSVLIRENADMVIGARTGKVVKINPLRRLPKYFLRKFAQYLSSKKIPDLNSGLRIVNKELVYKFFNLLPDGFSLTSTLTIALSVDGFKVAYVPINYYKRKGKSKIKPVSDTLNFLQLIVRTSMFFNPLKIFLPLSLVLFFVGILILLYSYFFLEKILDITVVLLLVSALQMIAIGMTADLIVKKIK
jgi:glycosyltransferase involved in cell wall biosynthesis